MTTYTAKRPSLELVPERLLLRATSSPEDDIAASSSEPVGSMMYPFRDLPLDRSRQMLRLWKFNQNTTNGCIHLDLAVFDHESCPTYIALSYVWGSYADTRTVYANTIPLEVTANLYDFLQILIEDPVSTNYWFWADQISMNQQDIDERDHQVSLMGKIYSSAAGVLAFLGDAPDPPLTAESFSSIQLLSDQSPLDNRLLSCLDILTRPYWMRLWIVQELLLARQIVFFCGRLKLERCALFYLSRYFEYLCQHRVATETGVWGLSMQNTLYRTRLNTFQESVRPLSPLLKEVEKPGGASLDSVLDSFSHKLCSDPRDKIFGLQALVLPRERITVDYSMPLEQLLCTLLNRQQTSNLKLAYVLDSFSHECRYAKGSRASYEKPPNSSPSAASSRSVDLRSKWRSVYKYPERLKVRHPAVCSVRHFRELLLHMNMPKNISLQHEILVMLAWAHMLPHLPTDIRNGYLASCDWIRMWRRVDINAVTPWQKRFSKDLEKLARAQEKEVKVSAKKCQQQRIDSDPPEPVQCMHCNQLSRRAREMIDQTASKRGFQMFSEFLCHPQDWPFASIAVTKSSVDAV